MENKTDYAACLKNACCLNVKNEFLVPFFSYAFAFATVGHCKVNLEIVVLTLKEERLTVP